MVYSVRFVRILFCAPVLHHAEKIFVIFGCVRKNLVQKLLEEDGVRAPGVAQEMIVEFQSGEGSWCLVGYREEN